MPLETNIEYRKRNMLNRVIQNQLDETAIYNEEAIKIINRLCHNLTAPRNFSNLNTTVSWVDRHLKDEPNETQLILRNFLEMCLVKYEQLGGTMFVIMELKEQLRAKGKTEEEIEETIARGH